MLPRLPRNRLEALALQLEARLAHRHQPRSRLAGKGRAVAKLLTASAPGAVVLFANQSEGGLSPR